jgi:ADP-ribose pyrophosphatase
MERSHRPECLSSETIYRGRIFDVARDVVRLPSGREQMLEIVRHGGAVAIAALDTDGLLLLVRQYRHAASDWLLEVPAGRVEPGEQAEAAARRELEEETGFRAARWSSLGSFWPAPGFCSERMSLFLARDLEPVGAGRLEPDPDEEIELVRMAPAAVLEVARDAKTLVAAALLLREPPAGP